MERKAQLTIHLPREYAKLVVVGWKGPCGNEIYREDARRVRKKLVKVGYLAEEDGNCQVGVEVLSPFFPDQRVFYTLDNWLLNVIRKDWGVN